MDISAISKTIFRNLKIRIIGKSEYGNEQWGKADKAWYNEIHNENTELHKDFQKYLNSHNDAITILEVGCGTGVYPIQQKKLVYWEKIHWIRFFKTKY